MKLDEYFFWLAPFWVAGVIALSVVFRLQRGKAIFPKLPADAIFSERGASGNSHRYWWGRIGGASNCLLIAITSDELIVTPFFPFNLMFLPEIYGFEVRVPRSRVSVSDPSAGLFGRGVRLTIRESDPYDVVLYPGQKANFLSALKVRKDAR